MSLIILISQAALAPIFEAFEAHVIEAPVKIPFA